MDITPAQREQVQKWLTHTFLRQSPHPSDESRPCVPYRSSFNNNVAFAFVAALNIPAILKSQIIKADATKQAIDSWTRWSGDTFSGRWTSGTLEWLGAKDKIVGLNGHIKGIVATHHWVDRLWLSRNSPLYTWITSGFVHLDLSHLVSNMIGLASVAPVCSRLPSMTPLHVLAITIGSSICASAAQVLEWKIREAPGLQESLTRAIGASGIVKAFIAVAAAGAPESSLPLSGTNVPCLVFGLFSFAGDVAGILRLDELMAGKQKSWLDAMSQPRVGYAAHLGGATFGLVYYYGILRHAKSSLGETETKPRGED